MQGKSPAYLRPSHPMRGAARDRHERAVGCGGRESCDRRVWLKRTVKSCGSDVAVLALSARGSSSCTDGGKKAVRRGEHEVSRKAIAQGRPGCSACTCMLVCAFLCANCTRDRGCSVHPVFPAPSHFGGQTKQSSGEMRRENAKPYPPSLPATNARRLRKGAKRRTNPLSPR